MPLSGRAQRHCMVVHNSYPHAEPRVLREAQALVAAGIEVDVISLSHREDRSRTERVGGVQVYRMPVRRDTSRGVLGQFLEYVAFLLCAGLRLSALHLRKRYAVIQVHNLPNFLVFSALVPRLTGARVILDIHDLMPEFYCSRFKTTMTSLPVRLALLEERMSCAFANHVITVTAPWRRALAGRSTREEKTSIVMNLADNASFDAARKPYTPPIEGEFRLIYHGAITRRYGIDIAIGALARVRNDLPELRMIIHGRGDYLEALHELVEAEGVGDIVRISSGLISTRDLAELISTCHLAVVPYRRDIFTDGILPTKLMEYAALGIPAVVSRTPAIESCFSEDMVHYVDSGDVDQLAKALLDLVRAPARLRGYSERLSGFSERHNWKQAAAAYVALVRTLGRR